jgi:metal transporter CNNM
MVWLGILLCISQSAMMSGLNLAVFSLSRLRLDSAAENGDEDARRVLALRRDANYTLATILWANVGINVLLTLLAESALIGVAAFLFSTVLITFAGEIFPQAYFSRHALRVASLLAPVLRVYRVLLWPVARPVGKLLDAWVGPEAIPWLREKELGELLRHHAREDTSEVGQVEATGAINFLALDDLAVREEGELLDPRSIVRLPFEGSQPIFPRFEARADDPFLTQLASSGKKWIVITDEELEPRLVLSAPSFLRGALFERGRFEPRAVCHRPLVVRDRDLPMGQVLGRLTVRPEGPADDVIDEDMILVWTDGERRIITGSDILGRLLRRIAHRASPS